MWKALLATVVFALSSASGSGYAAEQAQTAPGEEPTKPPAVAAYEQAERQLAEGNRQLPEETAKQAFDIDQGDMLTRMRSAFRLAERGLFAWAEREYRHVIQTGPEASWKLRARLMLSEMLHDQQRDLDAAEALQPLVQAMEPIDQAKARDSEVHRELLRLGREPASISARMHYFYAEDYLRKGDAKKQVEHLQEAVKRDPTEADTLIALYHAGTADETLRKEANGLIEKVVKLFRKEIAEAERELVEAKTDDVRNMRNHQLAYRYNQLAWLLACTEGDSDEALLLVQRAVKISSRTAAYHDTLARCFVAKGDFAAAVRTQLCALELEPHSGQMQRQLELFKKKLAESDRSGSAKK